MKPGSIVSTVVAICITQAGGQLALAKSPLGDAAVAKTNAVLQDSDIPGMTAEKARARAWWIGTSTNGAPAEAKGCEQFTVLQGVRTSIQYAEFGSAEEAHQAAEFHSTNMAAIFHAGMWTNAIQTTVGDEVWHVLSPSTTALLMRSGRVCVLVSCHGADVEGRCHVAETIMKRIWAKVKLGAQVILPAENTKMLP